MPIKNNHINVNVKNVIKLDHNKKKKTRRKNNTKKKYTDAISKTK